MPEPQYSIQGYASATITHAAAHKAHILYIPDKTCVLLEYIIYGLYVSAGLKYPFYGIIDGIWHAKPVITNP